MLNLGQQTFISSIFTILGQWLSRVFGIISIIIVARILTPEDYGIVAIAQLSISFLQIILFDGSSAYLIRKKIIENNDLDTAWTVRVILFIFMALCLFFGKEAIANFFNDNRLINILLCLSISTFISGFQNIAMIIDEKKLEYKNIFLHQLSTKLLSFIVTVGMAFYVHNYWSLVSGLLTMQISNTLLSYYFFQYRPSFTFCKIKEQWDFTKWIYLSNFTSYVRNKLDQVLISKFLEVKSLGFYNMSYQLSNMPFTEIVEPIQKVIYSSYSHVLNDKDKLASIFIQVIGGTSIIIFPIYFGLLILSKEFIFLLLGNKWTYLSTIFPPIILLLIAQIYSWLASKIITVLGKVKILTMINWLMVFIMIPTLLYTITYKELELFIQVRASLAVLFLPVFYLTLFQFLTIKKRVLLLSVIRPLSASLVMLLSIYLMPNIIEALATSIALIFKILFGAVVYIVTLLYLWIWTGRRPGGEEYILDKFYFMVCKNTFLKKYVSTHLRKIYKI